MVLGIQSAFQLARLPRLPDQYVPGNAQTETEDHRQERDCCSTVEESPLRHSQASPIPDDEARSDAGYWGTPRHCQLSRTDPSARSQLSPKLLQAVSSLLQGLHRQA